MMIKTVLTLAFALPFTLGVVACGFIVAFGLAFTESITCGLGQPTTYQVSEQYCKRNPDACVEIMP